MEHLEPSFSPEKIFPDHEVESDQVDLQEQEVRDTVMDLFGNESFDANSLEHLVSRFSQLPAALQKWALSVLSVAMILFAQGCMYAPRYGEVFRRAPSALNDSEVRTRQTQVGDLLANPTPATQTPALRSGIEPFQRTRLWHNFQDLINSVSSEDFQSYMTLCQDAKTTLGIMNPDRYDPAFLRTVLENYRNPELNRERPVIFGVVARKDKESIGGVQALNVETFRFQELTRAYKVILVETNSIEEILHHIDHLGQQNILRLGNLKGLVIVGHGSAGEIDVGLNVHREFMYLSRLNWYLKKNEDSSYIVLASCESGDGGESGFDGFSSFANQASLLFPKSRILACNGIMVGINFQTDAAGRLLDSSLQLERLSDMFTSGDTTYRPQYDDVIARAVPYYRQFIGSHVPVVYLELALRAGLIKSNDILQAFRSGVDPFEFRLYLDCGLDYSHITLFNRSRIPAIRIFQFYQAGVYSLMEILDHVKNGVTPESLTAGLPPGRRAPYLAQQR